MLGIANAVNACLESQLRRRINQECPQFFSALAVAPVADPDQVSVLARTRIGAKQCRVGSLMPGEHTPTPAALQIELAQHLAEGKHAVVPVQWQLLELFRGRDRAMMRVVEQKQEVSA